MVEEKLPHSVEGCVQRNSVTLSNINNISIITTTTTAITAVGYKNTISISYCLPDAMRV